MLIIKAIIEVKILPEDPSTAPDAPGVGINPTAVIANDVPDIINKTCSQPTEMFSDSIINTAAEYRKAKETIFAIKARMKCPFLLIKSLNAC